MKDVKDENKTNQNTNHECQVQVDIVNAATDLKTKHTKALKIACRCIHNNENILFERLFSVESLHQCGFIFLQNEKQLIKAKNLVIAAFSNNDKSILCNTKIVENKSTKSHVLTIDIRKEDAFMLFTIELTINSKKDKMAQLQETIEKLSFQLEMQTPIAS